MNLDSSYNFSTRLQSSPVTAAYAPYELDQWARATEYEMKPSAFSGAIQAPAQTTRTLLFSSNVASRPVIVIDPGHGGTDPGTVGIKGLQEKEITLDIAKRLQAMAIANGEIDIQLTRKADNGMSRLARLAAVQRKKPDLLLSLHFNNLPQKDVAVVETFYAGVDNIRESDRIENPALAKNHSDHTRNMQVPVNFARQSSSPSTRAVKRRANQSKRLASILQRRVFETVSEQDSGVQNNGIKPETLYMLTRSKVPGALIELSCLSHPEEEERLRSDAYRNRIASSLLDALLEYVSNPEGAPAV